MKKLIAILKWTLILAVIAIISGYTIEHFIRRDLNKAQPTSEENYVTIDGNRIYFEKKGNRGPTVVFEAGMGSDNFIWKELQGSIPDTITSISYCRPGLLWSDASDKELSLENYAAVLTKLLEKTKCPKPYILVGHSFAGITLRKFITDHKSDISEIIFVDVTHPDQIAKCSEELRNSVTPPSENLMHFLAGTGLIRPILGSMPLTADLPVAHPYNAHMKDYFYKSYEILLQEAAAQESLYTEAKRISTFDSIPLCVITGGDYSGLPFKDQKLKNEYIEIHKSVQKDLLNLSTKSKQIIAIRSGHLIPLQEPTLILNEIILATQN